MTFLAPFVGHKYLSLETFRADGTGVETPVWFVISGERLFCRSDPETRKIKRIRRDPSVTAAPCSLRGKVKGPRREFRVEFVPRSEWGRLEEAYERKYRLESLLAKLPFGGPPGQTGDQVFYELHPAEGRPSRMPSMDRSGG